MREFGETIVGALEDDVVKILVNPDGWVWLDSRIDGMVPCGVRLLPQEGEAVLATVAGMLGTRIDAEPPTRLPSGAASSANRVPASIRRRPTARSRATTPLLEIRPGDLKVRDAQNVADILVHPNGDRSRDLWAGTRALLVGVLLHVLSGEREKIVAGCASFLARPDRPIEDGREAMLGTEHHGLLGDRQVTRQEVRRRLLTTRRCGFPTMTRSSSSPEDGRSTVESTAIRRPGALSSIGDQHTWQLRSSPPRSLALGEVDTPR